MNYEGITIVITSIEGIYAKFEETWGKERNFSLIIT